MPGAGVEQRRAARQVGQRGHQAVELDRLGRALRQPAGHPHHEVLRRLDHQTGGGVAQQVTVVDRTQAEVLEPVVGVEVDREVELAGVVLDEAGGLLADQALGVAQADGLAEGGDALVADLLLDVRGQQPRGEPGVLRLLADHLGGGLDAEPVELGGGGAVVQAADGAGGDPHRVDVGEVAADAVDRPDDLVDVDVLGVAVALEHLHGGAADGLGRHGRQRGVDDRHFSLLARSVLDGPGTRRRRQRGPRTRTRPASALPRGLGPPRPTGAVRWQVSDSAARPQSGTHTVAGQSRSLTGFPVASPRLVGVENQLRAPPYMGITSM